MYTSRAQRKWKATTQERRDPGAEGLPGVYEVPYTRPRGPIKSTGGGSVAVSEHPQGRERQQSGIGQGSQSLGARGLDQRRQDGLEDKEWISGVRSEGAQPRLDQEDADI